MSILTQWFRLIQNFPGLLTDFWHKNSAIVSTSQDNEKNVTRVWQLSQPIQRPHCLRVLLKPMTTVSPTYQPFNTYPLTHRPIIINLP